MNFRVCIVIPPGYKHATCFVEAALLLKYSLTSLGHTCDIKPNDLSPEATNIVLGYHLIRYSDRLTKYRYIPYQLEQLSRREGIYGDNTRLVLEHAIDIWDYSRENIAFLKSAGLSARYLPVGYHEHLRRIVDNAPKDIDVLFYGSPGGRRKDVLDKLAQTKNLKTRTLFGVYGDERDAFIGRSKIVLNIHFYETQIFEGVRVSYLFNNGCFVLSEESVVNPYPNIDICFTSLDSVVEKCLYYCNNDTERNEISARNHEQFKKNYPMTGLLKSVLP